MTVKHMRGALQITGLLTYYDYECLITQRMSDYIRFLIHIASHFTATLLLTYAPALSINIAVFYYEVDGSVGCIMHMCLQS